MTSMSTDTGIKGKLEDGVDDEGIIVEAVPEPKVAKVRRVVFGNIGFFLTAVLSLVLLCALIAVFVQKGNNEVPFIVQPNVSVTDVEHVNSIVLFDTTSGAALASLTAQRVPDNQSAWFNLSTVQPVTPEGIAKALAAKGKDKTDGDGEVAYCNPSDKLLHIRTTKNGVSSSRPYALLPSVDGSSSFFECKWVAVVDGVLVVGDGSTIDVQDKKAGNLKLYVLNATKEAGPVEVKTAPLSELFPSMLGYLKSADLNQVSITSLSFNDGRLIIGLATPDGPMVALQSLDGTAHTVGKVDVQVASNDAEVLLTPLPKMKGMLCAYSPSTGEISIVDTNGTACSLPVGIELESPGVAVQ